MTSQTHVIGRQVLEFELDLASDRDAFSLQQALGEHFRSSVLPAMEALFDRCVPADTSLRLDRVELDLGHLPVDRLDETFAARVCAALETQLATHLETTPTGGEQGGQHLSQADHALELWHYVLLHGHLPWWAPVPSARTLEASVLAALEGRDALPPATVRLLREQPMAIRRIALQGSTALNERLLSLVDAKLAGLTVPLFEVLPRLVEQQPGGLPRADRVKQCLWQAAIAEGLRATARPPRERLRALLGAALAALARQAPPSPDELVVRIRHGLNPDASGPVPMPSAELRELLLALLPLSSADPPPAAAPTGEREPPDPGRAAWQLDGAGESCDRDPLQRRARQRGPSAAVPGEGPSGPPDEVDGREHPGEGPARDGGPRSGEADPVGSAMAAGQPEHASAEPRSDGRHGSGNAESLGVPMEEREGERRGADPDRAARQSGESGDLDPLQRRARQRGLSAVVPGEGPSGSPDEVDGREHPGESPARGGGQRSAEADPAALALAAGQRERGRRPGDAEPSESGGSAMEAEPGGRPAASPRPSDIETGDATKPDRGDSGGRRHPGRAARHAGPRTPEPRSKATGSRAETIFVDAAGIVLLHPYLTAHFDKLGLQRDGEFLDESARDRAVHQLRFLATGEEQVPEPLLVLEKRLCGLAPETPITRSTGLDAQAKSEADKLLQAVIRNWGALKNSSPDGLRETFLHREGRLELRNDGDKLTVESRGYDLLLNRLPWPLNVVRLPWMSDLLFVEWG